MKHFSAVLSVCRLGLEGGDPLFRQQVIRLRDRMKKSGNEQEALTLNKLLEDTSKSVSLAPSNVETSRSLVHGDELTENVFPPTDRETSVPLAEIILSPGRNLPKPVYDETIKLSFDALIQEWKSMERLSRLGVEPSRSCLLYGPPGTGKTLAALSLASQLHVPIVSARIDGLVSSYLGTTARNIANLFDFANRYRCILVLDEFDALAKMRDDPHELGELKRVVNTLLQNLDARANRGLTIAITNHDGLLDSAVWRRFQNHIKVDLPSSATRLSLLSSFLENLKLEEDVLKVLLYVAGPRSGSDLRTFADALKRTLALAGGKITPHSITVATRAILPRLGLDAPGMRPARCFLFEEENFIGSILHEGLGVKQESLAKIFNCSQSKISRIYSEWSSIETPTPKRAVNA